MKISVVDNETTASNLMLSGDLNLGIFSTRGAYERVEGSGFTSQTVPASATYMHFNFLKQDSPIQDLGVRRALAESVDRSALSKIATGAEDQTSNSVALPQSTCQSDVTDEGFVQYDAEAVEGDLESAGWTKSGSGWTKDGRPLKINLLVTGAPAPETSQWRTTSSTPGTSSGSTSVSRTWTRPPAWIDGPRAPTTSGSGRGPASSIRPSSRRSSPLRLRPTTPTWRTMTTTPWQSRRTTWT